MPSRLKRYQTEGHHHFLTFSCYHRLPYLADNNSRRVFLEVLESVRRRHQFLLFGYVLMPEHVHLLVSEPKAERLHNTLRVLKGQTSRQLRGSREQFWQTRYYEFNVLTHRKFVEKLRYIRRNPVNRGLVSKPEDWPWSSFRHWATGESCPAEIESHWTAMQRGLITSSSMFPGTTARLLDHLQPPPNAANFRS